MKIAITTEGETLDCNLDIKFGRAKGFIIYNIETDAFKFINNESNLTATQGAGIQSAQTIINEDVNALITGYCGPKAYEVLETAEIKIFVSEKDIVKNIINKFKNNELTEQIKDF